MSTPFSETAKGNSAILTQSVINGFFPVLIVISYASISPLLSLFFSVIFATVFFAILLTVKRRWREIFDPSVWRDIFFVVIFIGILYYFFFFYGLKFTSPGNASLLVLTEAFFSFLLFNVWKREQLSRQHIIGIILMLIGAAIILFPKTGHFNIGDGLIVLAAMSAPLGNYFQRKARQRVSSETVLFARSILSLPVIFLLAYFVSGEVSLHHSNAIWGILVVNGVLVLGLSKILWLEGIHRISVTTAIALLSMGPVFTLIFAAILLKQPPQAAQLIAFIPMALGLILITNNNLFKSYVRQPI